MLCSTTRKQFSRVSTGISRCILLITREREGEREREREREGEREGERERERKRAKGSGRKREREKFETERTNEGVKVREVQTFRCGDQ